ncbi:diguanylate cyclase domain-containing protein [Rhodoligotrophos ferricapiens]|uniref:diguanylate cyclase domain-containing protein n=1 Tax=Rhodoligotrophos ferricapiens TaxID=3069264 RepID=UPI00315D98DD
MAEFGDTSEEPGGRPVDIFDMDEAGSDTPWTSSLARSGYLELATMAAGYAAYHWDVPNDVLSWSANAAAILGVEERWLASNLAYASLMAQDGATSRYDAVHLSSDPDDGAGVPFRTEYRLRQTAGGSRLIWVEDSGRWFAGLDGRPAHVFGVVRLVDERRRQEERLRYLSSHDSLTGLMNRELIVEKLSAALGRAKSSAETSALLMLSVDNLQAINEIFGSDVADNVIRKVGRLIARVMRSGDHLGRYAGNKLALVLRNCADEEMRIASQRFLDAVRDTVISTPYGPVWATVSIGGVSLHAGIETAKQALTSAEHALSRARGLASGRFFASDVQDKWPSVHRQNLDQAAIVLRALQENQIILACEPILRPGDGSVVMHDVVPHIPAGVVPFGSSPLELIGICRKLGLISLVEVDVLRGALAMASADPELSLSATFSLATIEMPRARAQIIDALQEAGDAAERLVIDVPISAMVVNPAIVRAFLEDVQRRKARVALSDFGLDGLPLSQMDETLGSFVRLDGQLLREASRSRMTRARLKTAMEIARSFNAEIIGLDLDKDADAQLIADYGIDLICARMTSEPATGVPLAAGSAVEEPQPIADLAPLRREVSSLKAALAELNSRLAARAALNDRARSEEPAAALSNTQAPTGNSSGGPREPQSQPGSPLPTA